MIILKLFIVTLCSILVGSSVFCVAMSGPTGFFGAPFAALFGLVYYLPVLIAVGLAWMVYQSHPPTWRSRLVLHLCLCLAGGCLMFILGPRDVGGLSWVIADVLGGCAGGLVGAFMITKMKRYAA